MAQARDNEAVRVLVISSTDHMLLSSRTIGADASAGHRGPRRPAAATEEAALELAAAVAAHPPEVVARLKRMLHEWDGIEKRSRAEGEGQVEWQRSGPGLPYGD